jgi:hypothetical protein
VKDVVEVTKMRMIRVVAIAALALSSAMANSSMPKEAVNTQKGEQKITESIPKANPFVDRIELAQQFSNRCVVSPAFSCSLPRSAPVGTRCWCSTPSGPAGGVVR